MTGTIHKKHVIARLLTILLCILIMGVMYAGPVFCKGHQDKKISKDKNETEVLYFNEQQGVKIVKKNNFLLKIEKNEKGLNIVHELGPYPEAYPDYLPPPRTRIDGKNQQGSSQAESGE